MFENFLNQTFLDNTVKSYLIVAGVILVTILFKRIFSKYLAGLIARLIARKDKTFNKQRFQNLVLTPIETFLVILMLLIALDMLNYPEILNFKIYKTSFGVIMDGIAHIAIIISFIWLCTRLIDYTAELLHEKALQTNDRADDQLVIFFKDFFKVLFRIAGLLLIIKFGFGQSVGNVLTGLSIVGAALALAFRESLENLIASFIIFFDKPFTIGDLVKVQNITGTVETIGLRSTRIRTVDKTYVTVPNKLMVDSILDNQSLRTQRKVENRLELNLINNPSQINELIEKVREIFVREHVEDAAVFLSDTGLSSHVILIEYYTSISQPLPEFQRLRQNINLEIIDLLRSLGISLAAGKVI